MNQENKKHHKTLAFVDFIISRCQQDKGMAAALRRADNPATEYQSWEILATFHIDLEKAWLRFPYTTIAAAIAKGKIEHNGSAGIGRAIAASYEKGSQSEQAKAKLRRLLACSSVEEVCRIIRPLLALIGSRNQQLPDYAALLEQLLRFHFHGQSIKARWAQDFYAYSSQENTDQQEQT